MDGNSGEQHETELQKIVTNLNSPFKNKLPVSELSMNDARLERE